MRELESSWRHDIREKVAEFIREMGSEGKCIRLEALYEQQWNAEDDLKDHFKEYAKSLKQDEPYINREFIASFIPENEARIEKLKRQIRDILAEALGHSIKDRISKDMIERAREHPITGLIESSHRGNVLCIAHDEKHPSMSLKGNRARCFSCGYYGDSIDVYMKLHGSGFIAAVRALQ